MCNEEFNFRSTSEKVANLQFNIALLFVSDPFPSTMILPLCVHQPPMLHLTNIEPPMITKPDNLHVKTYTDQYLGVNVDGCLQSTLSACVEVFRLLIFLIREIRDPTFRITIADLEMTNLLSSIRQTSQQEFGFSEYETKSDKLFTGSSIGTINSNLLLRSYCTKFKLTDVARHGLYALLRAHLTKGTEFSSSYAEIARIKNN